MHGKLGTPVAKSSSAARPGRAAIAALLGSALLAAGGCNPVTRPPAARLPAAATPASGAPESELVRAIDAKRSEIRILVYRGGALGFLGHNHVLIARGLSGEVHERADGHGGRFELTIPVAALAVDEPAARREAGADFASDPSGADIAGTRQNLLGPEQLDAAAFAVIRASGRTSAATGGVVEAQIELHGRAVPLTVPVTVVREGSSLIASGELPLSQLALGLTPYSVLGGALQVRDQLQLRFRIVAVSRGGS